jgi:hypothetical protein
VVPDQLRISEGWVRCGQCAEVFDAAKHMLELAAPPSVDERSASAAEPELPVVSVSLLAAVPTSTTQQAVPDAQAVHIATSIAISAQDSAAHALPKNVSEQVTAEALEETAVGTLLIRPDDVSSSVRVELVETLRQAQGERFKLHRAVAIEDATEEVPQAAPNLEHTTSADWADLPLSETPAADLSFLNPPSAVSRWHQPLWRVLLGSCALFFMLCLLAQYLYHERDRLAAVHAPLKPLLQTLCQPLGCAVSPLRGIESVVLDSATFTKFGKDAYRLDFVVKNSAAVDLATPDIELTLTDMTDQVIVRRVLTYSELGTQTASLSAGAEWRVSTVLQVKPESNLPTVQGYRLLAFYP